MESQTQGLPATLGVLRSFTLSYRTGALIVLLVALFTHLPTPFGQFSSDDFLIRAMTVGDSTLFANGFSKADPDKSVWEGVLNAFHFYTPAAGTLAEYRDYGNLPWWTSDSAAMNPLRPLSAFTHWIDNQVAPASFQWHTFHTLIYVLLFAWSGYRLFWRISPSSSVAVLASLMLVVDFSHLLNFSWIAARNVFIAGALGCAALERFLAWRQDHSHTALALSLLLFLLGMLSAESTIALGAYLFAYLVFVERLRPRALVMALLPYGMLVVAWRAAYNLGGFGADGIGLYVDPGRSPVDFLLSALQAVPVLLTACMTTVDGALTGIAPDMRIWMILACALVSLGCLAMIWPLAKGRPMVQAMLAGSVLAAVPAAALISAGPRGGLFVGVGFFWVLAMWLHWLVRNPGQRLNRIVMGAVLCLHLLLPALAGLLYTSLLLPVAYTSNKQYESVAKSFSSPRDSTALVVVNSHAANTAFYLPFEWRAEHGTIPSALNLLAPGLVSFDLTRLSAREFELTAKSGLPLDHLQDLEDRNGHQPLLSSAYSLQMLQGLFTSPETQLYPGLQRSSGNIRVTVREMTEGRPSRLRIEFIGRDNPDTMAWQWYDWRTREYVAMPVPAIGETRYFAGPFDTQTESIVKLCVNCEN